MQAQTLTQVALYLTRLTSPLTTISNPPWSPIVPSRYDIIIRANQYAPRPIQHTVRPSRC